ncbi:hypothetical protein ACJX0J_008821, partial [Zea mays]
DTLIASITLNYKAVPKDEQEQTEKKHCDILSIDTVDLLWGHETLRSEFHSPDFKHLPYLQKTNTICTSNNITEGNLHEFGSTCPSFYQNIHHNNCILYRKTVTKLVQPVDTSSQFNILVSNITLHQYSFGSMKLLSYV